MVAGLGVVPAHPLCKGVAILAVVPVELHYMADHVAAALVVVRVRQPCKKGAILVILPEELLQITDLAAVVGMEVAPAHRTFTALAIPALVLAHPPLQREGNPGGSPLDLTFKVVW